ncbi:MAG: MFS transporter [Actinomycetota bacterium]|nr:MFS transporter [Actinomycetota bacterium]
MTLHSLRPLRQRQFALIWGAALVSNIGSWMQTIAVGVLVTAKTGRAGWTGLVAAAAFVPIGLLSPVGGVLADRLDRRKWLLLTTCGEAAVASVLTAVAATGHASAPVVTVLVFVGGSMAAIGFPAYQAMLPDLVDVEDLLPAIALSSAQFNLGRVVGPALAGVVIATGGYAWAFAVNAASFFAVVVALALVRLPDPVREGEHLSMTARLAQGARATVADAGCRRAVLAISVVALTASPFIALVPAVALKVFGSGSATSRATGTALLITAQGVGAVLGALAVTPLARRFGRVRVLGADLVVLCALLVAYGLAPDLALATLAIGGIGAAYIGVLSGLNTTIQLRTPTAYRGRVLGIYMMALGILYPIGALAQGAIGDRVGLRAVTAGGGAVLLVVIGLIVVVNNMVGRGSWLAPLEGPSHPTPLVAAAAEGATLASG